MTPLPALTKTELSFPPDPKVSINATMMRTHSVDIFEDDISYFDIAQIRTLQGITAERVGRCPSRCVMSHRDKKSESVCPSPTGIMPGFNSLLASPVGDRRSARAWTVISVPRRTGTELPAPSPRLPGHAAGRGTEPPTGPRPQ